MSEKDYRKQIGKKLEEAYLSQPMGETPSKETFAKWIEIAEQKRAERRRRRKKLVSCAAALVMCVVLGVACIFDPPQVAAGGKGGSKIEANLETNDVYKSQNELPKEIKERFLLFELPSDYKEIEVILEQEGNVELLSLLSKNENGDELCINQINSTGDKNLLNTVDSTAEKESVQNIDVYINQYEGGDKETTYTFIYNELLVAINAPNKVERGEILALIEKAVQ